MGLQETAKCGEIDVSWFMSYTPWEEEEEEVEDEEEECWNHQLLC